MTINFFFMKWNEYFCCSWWFPSSSYFLWWETEHFLSQWSLTIWLNEWEKKRRKFHHFNQLIWRIDRMIVCWRHDDDDNYINVIRNPFVYFLFDISDDNNDNNWPVVVVVVVVGSNWLIIWIAMSNSDTNIN